MVIGFYRETDEYGCFSNWYHAEFDYAGIHYVNAEQYMMYQKVMMFKKYDLGNQIMNTTDPHTCKKIAGQKFPEFNADLWEKTCYRIVKRGVKAKFSQNKDILKRLLDTGNALLAECSPYDVKWGIGIDIHDPDCQIISKWKGKNLLGRILMEVREELRQDAEYIDARHLDPIPEWNMTAGELKRIPQFYDAVHAYSETLNSYYERDHFYNKSTLYEVEKAMSRDMGGGLPPMGFMEMKQDIYDTVRRLQKADSKDQERKSFCDKYIPLLELIDQDEELKEACKNHSVYKNDDQHPALIRYLYDHFMHEAYDADIVIRNYRDLVEENNSIDWVAEPTEEQLKELDQKHVLACIAWHFRRDHFSEGSLIADSIANGYMLLMLKVYTGKN